MAHQSRIHGILIVAHSSAFAGEWNDAADVRRQREQNDLHGPPHRPRLRCNCSQQCGLLPTMETSIVGRDFPKSFNYSI
ncbi:unnamed protein product [Nezara viridula]|uniref:Uncharacterized protein n=1 Tax=Nezara viridula TaxID=85310 RepID=A0A9P0HKP5_NEZVI|nr:unnamed protein product [Nezara viridula]